MRVILIFLEPRKSTDNSYITIDLKSLDDSQSKINVTPNHTKEVSKNTDHIHSSMYGQNAKHNSVNRPGSLSADSQMPPTGKPSPSNENTPRQETPPTKIPHITRQRPSSLLVNKEEPSPSSSNSKICVRSKSVEDNTNNKKKNSINHVKVVKLVGSGESLIATSSLEKLTKLKEKLMQVSNDNRELPTNILDSDDESTPLVSDISTPSISLDHESPTKTTFRNNAFSPQSCSNSKSPENSVISSPSQQFSSPEAEHKNDNNFTDSTDFSPISPIAQDLVKVHGVAGGNTVPINSSSLDYLTPPQSFAANDITTSSTTSSNLSLSNYLEPARGARFDSSRIGSLTSVASFTSDFGIGKRKLSNASNLSRQNAVDKEERL